MRTFAAIVALTSLILPAVLAQGLPSGEGRCYQNPYKPEDKELKCIWGQLVAIFDCDESSPCSEEGATCYAEYPCEGCAGYVHCN